LRCDHIALGAGTFFTVSKARKSKARKEQVLSNALWAIQGPHLPKILTTGSLGRSKYDKPVLILSILGNIQLA
jgi:ribosomal protein L32